MGTDISGAIECRAWAKYNPDAPWGYGIDLDLVYTGRNYDAFGCLFGVRNYAGFRPIAASRGLPEDAADETRRLAARWEFHGATWVAWPELAAVDWAEPAEHPDARLHQYEQDSTGEWRYVTKSSWSPALAAELGVSIDEGMSGTRWWPEGMEWKLGDRLYRSERLTRGDAVRIDGDWKAAWAIMTALGECHGDENVRLIVWFND